MKTSWTRWASATATPRPTPTHVHAHEGERDEQRPDQDGQTVQEIPPQGLFQDPNGLWNSRHGL